MTREWTTPTANRTGWKGSSGSVRSFPWSCKWWCATGSLGLLVTWFARCTLKQRSREWLSASNWTNNALNTHSARTLCEARHSCTFTHCFFYIIFITFCICSLFLRVIFVWAETSSFVFSFLFVFLLLLSFLSLPPKKPWRTTTSEPQGHLPPLAAVATAAVTAAAAAAAAAIVTVTETEKAASAFSLCLFRLCVCDWSFFAFSITESREIESGRHRDKRSKKSHRHHDDDDRRDKKDSKKDKKGQSISVVFGESLCSHSLCQLGPLWRDIWQPNLTDRLLLWKWILTGLSGIFHFWRDLVELLFELEKNDDRILWSLPFLLTRPRGIFTLTEILCKWRGGSRSSSFGMTAGWFLLLFSGLESKKKKKKKDSKRGKKEKKEKKESHKRSSMKNPEREGAARATGSFERISLEDDYFRLNGEFRLWLQGEGRKAVFFDELSAEKARKAFGRFVEAWNNGRLNGTCFQNLFTHSFFLSSFFFLLSSTSFFFLSSSSSSFFFIFPFFLLSSFFFSSFFFLLPNAISGPPSRPITIACYKISRWVLWPQDRGRVFRGL